MSQFHLPLSQIAWQRELPHKVVKSASIQGTRVRLLRLERGYNELGWCTRPHVAYVVNGCLAICFDDEVITMRTGDAAVIPGGKAFQLRPELLSDEVLLLLIEPADPSSSP